MAKISKSTKEFERYYRALNLEQREAVDAIEGPVMVIAGPGTGKTQILTLRIANILKKTDTEPDNILALTFTESGVVSMRARLAEIIGAPAYYVNIETFHGFCNDVIKNYPEEFQRIIGASSITDIDQIKILEKIILEADIKILRPFGDTFYYLRHILNALNDLKREGVSVAQFKEILKIKKEEFENIDDLYYEKGAYRGKMRGKYLEMQKMLLKNKELCMLYGDYETALRKNKMYDYNDMVMEVVAALLKNKELLLILQEKYQYILVDEHQDTNNAQNKILELLAGYYKNPNLFVVGDEKQAIFRFQGASLENFLYFRHIYKKAKFVNLRQNYRSTQTILDTARSLRKESVRLSANIGHKEKPIRLYEFETPESENYFLAKSIEEKLAMGISPGDIAVLYRDNRDVLPIAHIFEKMGLPFTVESDRNILSDNDIKKLILLLRATLHFGNAELLLGAMHIDFLNIHPLDVYKVAELSRAEKKSPYEILGSVKKMSGLGIESAENIGKFYANLLKFKNKSKNAGLAEVFETVVRESGFLKYILGRDDYLDKLEKLSALSDEIRKLVEKHRDFDLKQFLEYIDMLQKHDVLIKSGQSGGYKKGVHLMTAHKSKGLEFEFVYIVNVCDKHWGNRRGFKYFELPREVYSLGGKNKSEASDNEDERNLFYVALTRAKKEIAVSYSKLGVSGREQFPSQFLKELDGRLVKSGNVSKYEKEFEVNRGIFYAPAIIKAPAIKDKEFIKELFIKYGLSVTALNNYLICPWRYFYSSLVRIPEAPNKHLMYGNAIHGALKDFFDHFREGDDRGKKFMIRRFKEILAKQPIKEIDYVEVIKKGEKALAGYYGTYHSAWPKNILNEFNIKSIELTPEIRLTGKIDKIEILNTANGANPARGREGTQRFSASNGVNVVDYKTGKPKSRGKLEGLTADSEGEYKRQLVFYNLLLDKYMNGKYKMVSGDIDFIEPDEKGRYKKEHFIIAPEEISELKDKILEVADEILNLKFWDKGCKEIDCKFCELREVML